MKKGSYGFLFVFYTLHSIMRVENHTIKGEGLRCKQPKEKARRFTNGKKTTDVQQGFQGKG